MASSRPAQPSYRVAIIGAGVAGLAAARELLRSKRLQPDQLIVLEASDRVGGRAYSVPFGSQKTVTIDAGAAWIHGASPGNMFFRDVVEPAQIAHTAISDRNPWLHPASCAGFQVFDGPELFDGRDVQHAWRINEALLQTLQRYATTEELSEAYHGWSVKRLVDALVCEDSADCALKQLVVGHERGPALLRLCLSLIEVWMGAASDLLQLDDFEEIDLIGDDPGPHCLVNGGIQQTAHHLKSSIPDGVIHTRSPVMQVEYSSTDGVTLHVDGAQKTQLHADYVVVTCSLGVLKSEKIGFSPPLPDEKRAVIERSSMGHYMKIVVEFPHVFWPEQGQFFVNLREFDPQTDSVNATQDRFRFPLVFSYFGLKGAPILEGVLFGTKALEASELEDGELVTAFVRSLKGVFADGIPTPVAHYITRWNKNPWVLGSYSYLTLDSTTEDPEILRRTVSGRVLFAGEATTMQYQGSLQGAFVTGLAAVNELDSLL